MERRLVFGAAGLGVAALLVALVVIGPGDFFLAERSTQVNESNVDPENATVLKTGSFTGVEGHEVSGNVSLLRAANGDLYLRFENYEQTQGPDVFIYVTPAAAPTTAAEIDAGTKVRIDGGQDNGESTKEGTFTQKLPDSVAAEDIDGVGAWCDQFATPFGAAALSDA